MGGKTVSFLASRVFVHHWPPDAPKWDRHTERQVEEKINSGGKEKRVTLDGGSVQIDGYRFEGVSKVGVTVPMFKKEARMVFEGHNERFDAHVHVTAGGKDYLEIFNKMIAWRDGPVHGPGKFW